MDKHFDEYSRRLPADRGLPCRACGSTTSAAVRSYGGDYVVCVANADGRDRCREREVANMLRGANDDQD